MERDNQFIGQSGAFLDAVERASRAAPMSRPVLVIGERMNYINARVLWTNGYQEPRGKNGYSCRKHLYVDKATKRESVLVNCPVARRCHTGSSAYDYLIEYKSTKSIRYLTHATCLEPAQDSAVIVPQCKFSNPKTTPS